MLKLLKKWLRGIDLFRAYHSYQNIPIFMVAKGGRCILHFKHILFQKLIFVLTNCFKNLLHFQKPLFFLKLDFVFKKLFLFSKSSFKFTIFKWWKLFEKLWLTSANNACDVFGTKNVKSAWAYELTRFITERDKGFYQTGLILVQLS